MREPSCITAWFGLPLVIMWTACAVAGTLPRPRIFITRADLARLRAARASTTWAALQKRADAFVAAEPYHYQVTLPAVGDQQPGHWEYTLSDEAPPRHDDYRHYPPWTAMFQEREDSITTRLRFLCLAFVVTGEARYFDRARRIVLHLCAWPGVWTDPSYAEGKPCLDTGHAAMWVGIFFDWCFDALSPQDRQLIARALADKALAPIDEMIESVPAYHNYNAVIAAGLGIGAIALTGHEPRAAGWLAHAAKRMVAYCDRQGKGGGAMEGPMYGTYAADRVADLVWALTSAGIDNALVEHPFIQTLPRYCISLLNPDNHQQPCFGDGGPGAGFGYLMLALAMRGDQAAAWYCQQIDFLTPDTPRRFLAVDADKVRPRQPTFNPSAAFIDVGYAVLRNGYDTGGGFLGFKCGPPERVIGHNHYDHNSFVISYAGAWTAWDPGYRSYFDPPARKYTTSSFGHNTIVLDMDETYLKDTTCPLPGHDQVRLDGGRIAAMFSGPDFDYVLGQAAAAYNSSQRRCLDRFDRHIFFVKPDLFIIRDELAAPEPHTFSWMLHLPRSGFFNRVDDGFEGVVPSAALDARIYSPRGLTFTSGLYPGAETYGPWAAATTRRATAVNITAVLAPRAHDRILLNGGFEHGMIGWRPRRMPGFTENHVIDDRVRHSGERSARIDNGGYYYSQLFSAPPGAKLTARWWARCTAATGASSLFYFWRGGKSFANLKGPAATVDEWRPYEFTATVPEGAEQICLALQFFGHGQCWYDDVFITTDAAAAPAQPVKVEPLRDGGEGVIVCRGEQTVWLVCNPSGGLRRFAAGGADIATDAAWTVIRRAPGRPVAALAPAGSHVLLDGAPAGISSGEWLLTSEQRPAHG